MRKQVDADTLAVAEELATESIEAADEAAEVAAEEAREAGRAAGDEEGAVDPPPRRQRRKTSAENATRPADRCTDFPMPGVTGCDHAGVKNAAGRCAECELAWESTDFDAETPAPHLTVNFHEVGKAMRPAQTKDRTKPVDGNGGQIVRAVLEYCGFDMEWFSPSRAGPTARRALRRINGRCVIPPANRSMANKRMKELVDDGSVFQPQSMPASVRRYEWVPLGDEEDAAYGWRATDVDEPGSIVPILKSVKRELEQLRKKRVLRVHESFSCMDSAALDEQIDSGGFIPAGDREWMKSCDSGDKRTRVWREYVLSRSVLMIQRSAAEKRKCGRGCQTCEAVPCCSGCERSSHTVPPCACAPKPPMVFACKRCKYVGMGHFPVKVRSELQARGISIKDMPAEHDQLLTLALILRYEEVSALLEALGEPVLEGL